MYKGRVLRDFLYGPEIVPPNNSKIFSSGRRSACVAATVRGLPSCFLTVFVSNLKDPSPTRNSAAPTISRADTGSGLAAFSLSLPTYASRSSRTPPPLVLVVEELLEAGPEGGLGKRRLAGVRDGDEENAEPADAQLARGGRLHRQHEVRDPHRVRRRRGRLVRHARLLYLSSQSYTSLSIRPV